MKGEFKITCEESGDNFGFLIERKGRKEEVVHYNELNREEQLRVLNMLASGFDLFKQFLKEE